MAKPYQVMIMDDNPEGPLELYTRAVKGVSRFVPSPKVRKTPEISPEDLLETEILILDHDFGEGQKTGSDVLKTIRREKEKDKRIKTRVILISQFKDYQRWGLTMEEMPALGVVTFIDRRTRAPEVMKFHLNHIVGLLEKEKEITKKDKEIAKKEKEILKKDQQIEEQKEQLSQAKTEGISKIPIEVAQKQGPDIEKIARQDGGKPVHSILIAGATGTGKGFLADYFIRTLADVRGENLKAFQQKCHHVNCASFGELIGPELFGVCKGTATNVEEKNGRLADSDGGVLFLDEFEELRPEDQAKILVALETGKYYRAHGGIKHPKEDHTKPRSIQNLKVIVAINEDISSLLGENRLRWDLYYRFDYTIKLRSLTEYNRRELQEMIQICCNRINTRWGFRKDFDSGKSITTDAVNYILSKQREMGGKKGGNLRQLEKLIERTMTLTDKKEISAADLEHHYDYELSMLSPGIKEETSKNQGKNEVIDDTDQDAKPDQQMPVSAVNDISEGNIAQKLIDDRDRANVEYIEKFGQEEFNQMQKAAEGDLFNKYCELRKIKLDKKSDYTKNQKVEIAKQVQKLLIQRGEKGSKKMVAIAAGMSYGYLRQAW